MSDLSTATKRASNDQGADLLTIQFLLKALTSKSIGMGSGLPDGRYTGFSLLRDVGIPAVFRER